MSNNGVIIAVVSGLLTIIAALIAAWVKRIEGRDKIFRNNMSRDMRVMYALKDDYNHLHTWALDVRSEDAARARQLGVLQNWVETVNSQWGSMQRQLAASGAITQISDLPPSPDLKQRPLPPIPEPEWRRIELEDDDR